MIETRLKQIFDFLTKDYEYHTSEEIGKALQLSSKTIQKEMTILNTHIKDSGAFIESNPGFGYLFKIIDEDKFKKFLKDDWYKHAYFVQDSVDKEARIESITRLFLFSNSYIKQQEIADTFYISLSQAQKDIAQIKVILSKYNLSLESKPYYGMKVEGEEKNIRQAIKNEVGIDPSIYENNELFNQIQEIIADIDYGPSFYMPYVNFKNLVIHIYISILRIRDNKIIEHPQELQKKIVSYEEFEIANLIVDNLNAKLDMEIPYQELVYIAMHLVAKNTITKHEKLSTEVSALAQEMIDTIYEVTKYDFRSNIDLYFSLSAHLGPLLERIKYDFDMKNPILDDIKENQVAFFIATIASNVINENYDTKLSEDEIGYIALHVMTAMGNNSDLKKDILVVCGSGNSSAQIMKSQLKAKFANQINKLELTDISKIDEYRLDDYDFIVSSIKLDVKTSTPIVYVDILFKQKDIKNIESAMKGGGLEEISKIFKNSVLLRDVDLKDMDQTLDLLADIASPIIGLEKEDIIGQYKQREDLGSTALVTDVALPHILQQVDAESFSIILIPKKEVDWNKDKAGLIYSLFVGKEIGDMSLYYDKLGDFLINDQAISKAKKAENTTEFMNTFIKGE